MLLTDEEVLVAAPEAARARSYPRDVPAPAPAPRFQPPPAAPRDPDGEMLAEGIDDNDFYCLLLAALATMASKSKRRQADLDAAMARAKLRASPERIRAALRHLQDTACVRDIVPLYDGGLLLVVTNIGMDTLGRAADWRFLQQIVGRTH